MIEKRDLANGFPQRRIERCGGGDDLREAGGAGEVATKLGSWPNIRHPMKSLRPPLIPLYPQPRHPGGIVHQQPHFLLHRQPPNQVPHSLSYPQTRPAKRKPRIPPVFRVTRKRVTCFDGDGGDNDKEYNQQQGGGGGGSGGSHLWGTLVRQGMN